MATLSAPPVLSTPESSMFADAPGAASSRKGRNDAPRISDEELHTVYEIKRTIREIQDGKWRRIALQFPDEMLRDAPRVFETLDRGLRETRVSGSSSSTQGKLQDELQKVGLNEDHVDDHTPEHKLYILGDTSYGACCVDEIAAEHVDAQVVVHYGRSCLSSTARLPVIYVFTHHPLSIDAAVQAFKDAFPDRAQKVILMADVTYADHIPSLHEMLKAEDYQEVFATQILHSPASPLPNRTMPEAVANGDDLRKYHLFHLAEPPGSLLLTLSSRLASVRICPAHAPRVGAVASPLAISTALALRRRYALVTSLSTASVFGILINTLSVSNYLQIVEYVKAQIAAAGKKSYTFVVGKVNAAKLANFGEIGGWVVIGCWESSLIESKDFWKPVITPFELDLALQRDSERIWTGEWRSDFNDVLAHGSPANQIEGQEDGVPGDRRPHGPEEGQDDGLDSEAESEPPEFDLQTGRYVSQSRPMQRERQLPRRSGHGEKPSPSQVLTIRGSGELATIRGHVSPGAEFLRSQRTWRGLGSDLEIRYEDGQDVEVDGSTSTPGTSIAQGRSGIAKGYSVGDGDELH